MDPQIELTILQLFDYQITQISIVRKSCKTELSEVHGKDGTVIGWVQTESGEIYDVLRQALIHLVVSLDCVKTWA